jgi:hypothetical protein
MENTKMTAGDLAMAAFDNEILSVPVADKNRQYKALMAAHANACIYSPDFPVSTLELQHAVVALARSMGYSL